MNAVLKESVDDEVAALLETIYQHYHHDFRQYAPTSIYRRIDCAVRRLNLHTVANLRRYLLRDRLCFDEVLSYLVVPVSAMFRDPLYFLRMRHHVMPILKSYASPKIWVAGCSTGEEVYSLAIVLHEEGILDRSIIYATDINTAALQRAERGIFPVAHLQAYTDNYHKAGGVAEFSRYYHAAYEHFVVDRGLRKRITFSDHSLATDSVFAEMNFISCRNTLIYFDKPLKDRALGVFHESLCRKGFLGLGPKESIEFSASSCEFEIYDKSVKIFRKKDMVDDLLT